MINQHPIIPSTELLDQWCMDDTILGNWRGIAIQAAQWGADQELEACCEWFVRDWTDIETADKLRDARRPKPPSLKEQALAELDRIPTHDNEGQTWGVDVFTIRRALEALDD